jgi:hypothetical protein
VHKFNLADWAPDGNGETRQQRQEMMGFHRAALRRLFTPRRLKDSRHYNFVEIAGDVYSPLCSCFISRGKKGKLGGFKCTEAWYQRAEEISLSLIS